MPKRPRFIHPVRQVRTCLAHTQASFAKLLGCAAITIQRIENGPLRLSEKLANTILETTGANPTALLKGKALDRDGKPFTKESSEKYKALASCVDSRQHHRQTLFSWIELLLIASERAGQSKMDAVVANIQIFLKKLAVDFNLDKNIKGFLVEHGSVRKRSYRVSDLRKFPAYAKIIGYTDNKRFKPEKILAFEIPTGWIHDFAALDECPVLPKDLEKKYRGKIRIIGFDRPLSKEIQEDFSKALFWKIRKFILAW
jgi:DNA-binding XRE family transcriptional regulator